MSLSARIRADTEFRPYSGEKKQGGILNLYIDPIDSLEGSATDFFKDIGKEVGRAAGGQVAIGIAPYLQKGIEAATPEIREEAGKRSYEAAKEYIPMVLNTVFVLAALAGSIWFVSRIVKK